MDDRREPDRTGDQKLSLQNRDIRVLRTVLLHLLSIPVVFTCLVDLDGDVLCLPSTLR